MKSEKLTFKFAGGTYMSQNLVYMWLLY